MSKVARVHLITPIIDAGLFYVPESKKIPGEYVTWAEWFIAQCKGFPRAEHDEGPDCLSMGLYYLDGMDWFEMPVADEDDEDDDVYAQIKKLTNPYAS